VEIGYDVAFLVHNSCNWLVEYVSWGSGIAGLEGCRWSIHNPVLQSLSPWNKMVLLRMMHMLSSLNHALRPLSQTWLMAGEEHTVLQVREDFGDSGGKWEAGKI
jgi:hypothetical protein